MCGGQFLDLLLEDIKHVQDPTLPGMGSALQTGLHVCCQSTLGSQGTTPPLSALGGAARRTRAMPMPGSSTERNASVATIHLQQTPSSLRVSAIGSAVGTTTSFAVHCGE